MKRAGSQVRSVVGLIAARREQAAEDTRCIEARARFWDELRKGQREAEANSPRSDQ
jgi:hypothetical protein